jgi:hypothetical protein
MCLIDLKKNINLIFFKYFYCVNIKNKNKILNKIKIIFSNKNFLKKHPTTNYQTHSKRMDNIVV